MVAAVRENQPMLPMPMLMFSFGFVCGMLTVIVLLVVGFVKSGPPQKKAPPKATRQDVRS